MKTQNESGWAPLHEATVNGHLEVVQLLLHLGADIGIRTFEGDTPLHKAVRWGHAEVVRKLLVVGADKDAIDLVRTSEDISSFCTSLRSNQLPVRERCRIACRDVIYKR